MRRGRLLLNLRGRRIPLALANDRWGLIFMRRWEKGKGG